LGADPGEPDDLAGDERYAELARQLDRRLRAQLSGQKGRVGETQLDPDTLDKLRQLGCLE
jgi:hypothetical protein